MNTYKTLISEQKHPSASQRAGPHNILVGDVVSYTTRTEGVKYAKVITVNTNTLKIRDLFFEDNKYFKLDDNHSEQNSSHRGTFNYNYTINKKRARNIKIVDRNQFESIDNTIIDNTIIDNTIIDNTIIDNTIIDNTIIYNKERDTKQIIINYKNNDYILEDNILYEIIKTKGEKFGTLINSKIDEF